MQPANIVVSKHPSHRLHEKQLGLEWLRWVLVISLFGCGGGGEVTTQPQIPVTPTHSISGSVLLSSATGSKITDIELLVDGIQIAHQTYPQGSLAAIISGTKSFSSAGTHSMALHIIGQTLSPTTYDIQGLVSGTNTTNNSQVNVSFPTSQSISTGGIVSVSVAVP